MTMYKEILRFWFEEINSSLWWKKDEEFDQLIRTRFSDLHRQARHCELYAWRDSPEGRLAEIIVLDQFSRNLFRKSSEAFTQDPLALALSQEAIAAGDDIRLVPTQRCFMYMPFMHSESLDIHQQAVRLFEALGSKSNLEFELRHKQIIEKFGRYPHRNALLQRESTIDEVEFLKQPGSGF